MSPFSSWSGRPPRRHTENDVVDWLSRQPLPTITFAEFRVVDAPPANDSIAGGEFYRVVRNGQDKWALFLCPCGCSQVITLSLQRAHKPRWVVTATNDGRPSMRPSVWRDVGCLSHFWLEDGRVYWCRNTGTSPEEFSGW
jgi:hypothetical protein